ADGDDLAEVPAEIDDEAGAERLAGHAGAGAAGHQRDLVLAGVADQGAHVVLVARHHDAGRHHLEDGGVGAVEAARQVVEEQVALDDPLEVVAQALGLRKLHRTTPAISVARAAGAPGGNARGWSTRTACARGWPPRHGNAPDSGSRRSRP